MYSLFGIEENIENLIVLSSLCGNFPETTAELKKLYKDYLRSIQPIETVSSDMNIELVWDQKESKKLIELFSAESKLNDLNQETVISKSQPSCDRSIKEKTLQALNSFGSFDPALASLFQCVIEKIFFAGSVRAGGGSSSAALGCIWLNPRETWTEQDYLEFFVHELTHNLLFLDERRESHYPFYSELDKKENYAFSAILKRGRPLDKVVHSLFVVYEVLAFRLKHFDPYAKTFLHPDTETLFRGAEDALKSLVPLKSKLVTEHLQEMLHILEEKLNQLKVVFHENYEIANV